MDSDYEAYTDSETSDDRQEDLHAVTNAGIVTIVDSDFSEEA